MVISELVVEEVENLNNKERNEIKQRLNDEIKKAEKLYNKQIAIELTDYDEEYSFKGALCEKTENVLFINYSNISQGAVVKRALTQTRPFQENEKGYRDTLIWLSFINFLKERNSSEKIAFVSNNKSDFFSSKSKPTKLHVDLQKDLEDNKISCNLSVYDSLFRFVESVIDKKVHALNHNDFFDNYNNDFDPFLEEETAYLLESLPKNSILLLLSDAGKNPSPISNFINLTIDLFEGVEDPVLLHCEKLDEDNIYVNYEFNLRIVDFNFTIPVADYYNNKEYIENEFINIEISEDKVDMSIMFRVYVEASFQHSISTELQSGFSATSIYLK